MILTPFRLPHRSADMRMIPCKNWSKLKTEANLLVANRFGNHLSFLPAGQESHPSGLQPEVVRPAGDSGRGAGEEHAEREQDGLARGVHGHVPPADDLQRSQGPGRDVQTAAATQDRVTAVAPFLQECWLSFQDRSESPVFPFSAAQICNFNSKPLLLLEK